MYYTGIWFTCRERMPAKTPQHLIDAALDLYLSGATSAEAGAAVGVSAGTVSRWASNANIIRTISEAKKLHYQKNPVPLSVVDGSKIYGSETGTKVCCGCGSELPATTDHFYVRKRSNGRRYLSSLCKPCVKEDRADRYKSNPDSVREANRRSVEKHGHRYRYRKSVRLLFDESYRDAVARRNKEWTQRNRGYIRIYRMARRAENPEYIRNLDREYRKRNRESIKANRATRKARLRGAGGVVSKDDILRQVSSQHSMCFWCESEVGDNYHVDHLIPIARGGTNSPDNIVISCPRCNVSRGAKMPDEFREYLKSIEKNIAEIELRRTYLRQKMREHRDRLKSRDGIL